MDTTRRLEQFATGHIRSVSLTGYRGVCRGFRDR
jgi:hypothetical protein